MADVMTFEQRKGAIEGKRIAWTGDTNNVLTSWVHAAGRLDFELTVATPEELARTYPSGKVPSGDDAEHEDARRPGRD